MTAPRRGPRRSLVNGGSIWTFQAGQYRLEVSRVTGSETVYVDVFRGDEELSIAGLRADPELGAVSLYDDGDSDDPLSIIEDPKP